MNGYFGIKRKEMESDRDDLLEEREETLPQTGLHLKNATMLTNRMLESKTSTSAGQIWVDHRKWLLPWGAMRENPEIAEFLQFWFFVFALFKNRNNLISEAGEIYFRKYFRFSVWS